MREVVQKKKPLGSHTKFFEKIYKLKTGLPAAAAMGLEDRMCVAQGQAHEAFHALIAGGVAGIQREVDSLASESPDGDKAREVQAILRYIRFEETGGGLHPKLDKGNEGKRLSDFCAHGRATKCGLSEAEVVAIRLYTTLAYSLMNDPLRDDGRYRQGRPCPLAVTTHFAASGIKKLRRLNADRASEEITLWRGMCNLEKADDFLARGGTELAFMSTTRDLEVAARYCLSPTGKSVLLKLVCRNFMTTGADVHWLSAYPEEAEVLFPPLTYLRPTGRTETVVLRRGGVELSFAVVEVEPHLS